MPGRLVPLGESVLTVRARHCIGGSAEGRVCLCGRGSRVLITVVTKDPQSRGSVSPVLCKGSRGAESLSMRSRTAPNPSDSELVGSKGGTNPIGLI